jgi:hypothetical protein
MTEQEAFGRYLALCVREWERAQDKWKDGQADRAVPLPGCDENALKAVYGDYWELMWWLNGCWMY